MNKIEKELTLFGDFYYETTCQEIASYAESIKKYSEDIIIDHLKNIMQDIIAHILGTFSFKDACMAKTECKINVLCNNKIGKRKLCEFFALVEELDKIGFYVDKIAFPQNKNDEFLKSVLANPNSPYTGKFTSYLTFSDLNEFLEQILAIFINRPLINKPECYSCIMPNPDEFNYRSSYYPSINYLEDQHDLKRHEQLLEKHPNKGDELSLEEYIKKLRERYSVKSNFSFEFSESDLDEMNSREIEYLKQIIIKKDAEIKELKESLIQLRQTVKEILAYQNVEVDEKEFNNLENTYIVSTIIKSMSKKTKKSPTLKHLLYATIITSLIMAPHISKTNKTSVMPIKANDEVEETTIPDIPEEISLPLEDKFAEESEDTSFTIGEMINVSVPTYECSTTNEINGFLNQDAMVLGLIANG